MNYRIHAAPTGYTGVTPQASPSISPIRGKPNQDAVLQCLLMLCVKRPCLLSRGTDHSPSSVTLNSTLGLEFLHIRLFRPLLIPRLGVTLVRPFGFPLIRSSVLLLQSALSIPASNVGAPSSGHQNPVHYQVQQVPREMILVIVLVFSRHSTYRIMTATDLEKSFCTNKIAKGF